MISYPLLFIHGGRKTHVQSRAAFLTDYSTIFTAPVRQAIAQQSANCRFGNDMGAMVGNGEVWFTELTNGSVKIITVNPHSESVTLACRKTFQQARRDRSSSKANPRQHFEIDT